MPVIRIALAQMNSVVGGLSQNVETLHRLRTQAGSVGASLVISPELALTGYPPEDLLLKEGFCDAARLALDDLALSQNLPPLLVGTIVAEGPDVTLAPSMDGRDVTRLVSEGRVRLPHIANALACVSSDGVGPIATKRLLPNYDVFDEQRYFHPGARARHHHQYRRRGGGDLDLRGRVDLRGSGRRTGRPGCDVIGGGQRVALRPRAS